MSSPCISLGNMVHSNRIFYFFAMPVSSVIVCTGEKFLFQPIFELCRLTHENLFPLRNRAFYTQINILGILGSM